MHTMYTRKEVAQTIARRAHQIHIYCQVRVNNNTRIYILRTRTWIL